MNTLLTAAILLLALPALAQTAPKEMTFRGNVSVGTLDSSIGDDQNAAVFLTQSEVGRKIFATCGMGDRCEVTGKVKGKYSQLVSVSRVRLLAAEPSQVLVLDTPSFTVKIEVLCAEGNVTCEDVIYTGKSKRNGGSVSLKGRTMHSKCADGTTPCRFQGYTFGSGKITYQVLEEGELIVMNGDKTLVDEKGTWR